MLVISYLAHQGSIALPLLSMVQRGWEGAGMDGIDRHRRSGSFRSRRRGCACRLAICRRY